MTSHRRRKKQAAGLGLSERELQLAELLEEMLEALRWQQILGYANQYLLQQKLALPQSERDKILEAATRTVDGDSKQHEWRERLARIKGEIVAQRRGINRAKKQLARERGRGPGLEGSTGA